MTLNRRQILNILHRSLIGLQVTVIDHTDPSLIQISGIIQNESRNTLSVEINDKVIQISKEPGKFKLISTEGSVLVDGRLLIGDENRRQKRKFRHW